MAQLKQRPRILATSGTFGSWTNALRGCFSLESTCGVGSACLFMTLVFVRLAGDWMCRATPAGFTL